MSSISAFAKAYRPQETPLPLSQAYLEIYLILYDLLNDDDEDIRDIAASTASRILCYSCVSPDKAVALSPLNASVLFASFITTTYADSRLLFTRALRYILGLEPRIGDSANTSNHKTALNLVPVFQVIAELRKESTVLFEEEKQNLFIEAVREIDLWSGLLKGLDKSAYDEQLFRELLEWVSDGLDCFSETLSRPDGEDGLLGWMAKPEAYTLGVRVMSLAGVLGSSELRFLQCLNGADTILKEKLRVLLESGKRGLLHVDLLERIECALGSG